MEWQVPAPHATLAVALEDGALTPVRRHGNPAGPRLFVSHGNGFAADAYLPFWGPLLERFEVLVFDQRNHGHNAPSAPEHHTYAQIARDLERVYQEMTTRLGAKLSVGVFHSMSGRAAMKHAIEIGWRWDALVLFDPPNMPPPDHPRYAAVEGFENKPPEWALGRRRRFASDDELATEYEHARGPPRLVDGAHAL